MVGINYNSGKIFFCENENKPVSTDKILLKFRFEAKKFILMDFFKKEHSLLIKIPSTFAVVANHVCCRILFISNITKIAKIFF